MPDDDDQQKQTEPSGAPETPVFDEVVAEHGDPRGR